MKRWLFLMSVLVCLSGCAHKVEMISSNGSSR